MNITRRKHSRNCAVLVCYQRGCPDQKIAQNKAMYLKISISPFNRLHMNPFKCIITSCKVYPLLSLSFGYCFQRRFASLFPSFPSSLSFFFSSNKYGIFADLFSPFAFAIRSSTIKMMRKSKIELALSKQKHRSSSNEQ